MKAKGRPIVNDSDPKPENWTITYELVCPAFGAPEARCAVHPWSMERDPATHPTIRNPPTGPSPKWCRQKITRITVPIWVAKHADQFPKVTFDHEDHYSWNRTHNEHRSYDWVRPMLGGL